MLREVREQFIQATGRHLEKKSFNSCPSLGQEAKASVFTDKQIHMYVNAGFEAITPVYAYESNLLDCYQYVESREL